MPTNRTCVLSLLPLVSAALALDAVSDDYRVRLDPDEARAFIVSLPGAEATDEAKASTERLTALLAAIDQAVPAGNYGPENPNTGLPSHTYFVGREGSRLIMLDWVRSYAPRGFDFDALAARLGELAREAGADECDLVENGPLAFRCRLWWD